MSGGDDVLLSATTPLQLCYYGNPVLRKRAEPIGEIMKAECQLVEQILGTPYAIETTVLGSLQASWCFEMAYHC